MQFNSATRQFATLILLAVLATGGAAQVTTIAYLPDANAGTGVVGNMIPFSSVFGNPAGAWTHLTIVPAAMLAQQGVQPWHRLVDIRFAPTGSGTLHVPDIQVRAGHLVSPLPTFSLAGGFADAAMAYDSAFFGPLDVPCVANTWCSLGVGGGNFTWNGVSDVGIYTTHAGLTITSTTGWQGSFWRDAALMRHYANGYQAATALTSSLNALKLSLVFVDPWTIAAAGLATYGGGAAGSLGIPALVVPGLPAFGNADFGVGVAQALPGTVAVLLASSAPANQQIGFVSDVRLLVDFSPGVALAFVAPVGGDGTAFLPASVPPWNPGLAGLTVFCQWAIVGDAGAQPTVAGPLALTPGLAITVGF